MKLKKETKLKASVYYLISSKEHRLSPPPRARATTASSSSSYGMKLNDKVTLPLVIIKSTRFVDEIIR